jgi:hypothetical protein
MTTKKTGLELLREPFPETEIGKLPKPTQAQTEAVKSDFKKGVRCNLCGAWHHPDVVHLDYVGHAALTNRLLDADPNWSWEPMAVGPDGYPVLDKDGGMWIKLTVCGITRIGYGDAQGKTGGNAMKERIGDALRNAAMRFGAALDLWHKGELSKTPDGEDVSDQDCTPSLTNAQLIDIRNALVVAGISEKAFCENKKINIPRLEELPQQRFPGAMAFLKEKAMGATQ